MKRISNVVYQESWRY